MPVSNFASRQGAGRAIYVLGLLLVLVGVSFAFPPSSSAEAEDPVIEAPGFENAPASMFMLDPAQGEPDFGNANGTFERNRSAGATVPGAYIVVLEDSVKHPASVADAQTEDNGGKVALVYRHALKGYSAKLSKEDVQALRKDPLVKYVVPDRKVEAFAQLVPRGVERVFAPGNETLKINEKDDWSVDADVAVLDTGIDSTEQPGLNVVQRTNCIPVDYGPEPQECSDDGAIDGHGHGTHVAGTIGAIDDGESVAGVAPGVRLWAVKVLSNGGGAYESWIIAGVDWVTAHASQIEVANMSLGCGPIWKQIGEEEWEPQVCKQPALAEAIEASVDAGVVYAVAAGNAAVDAKYVSPANHPDVITVSAIADYDGKPGGSGKPLDGACNQSEFAEKNNYGKDDSLAIFSNYGEDVDVAAPGVCIDSTVRHGIVDQMNGTSMATPHVTGAAAVLASSSNPSSRKDVEAIRQAIVEAGNTNWTDTSEDGVTEPLLDVGDEEVYDAGVIESPQRPSLKEAWTVESTTAPEKAVRPYLLDVSCPVVKVCVAIGGAGQSVGEDANPTFSQHWNGEKWSLQSPLPRPAEASVVRPKALSCTSASACTAVGYYYLPVGENGEKGGYGSGGAHPVAWRWNGEKWQLQEMPKPPAAAKQVVEAKTFIWDVSCTSATSCTSVGLFDGPAPDPNGFETLAEHWDGKAWSIVQTPTHAKPEGTNYETTGLSDISCVSVSDCVAIGEYSHAENFVFKPSETVILDWNGEKWTFGSTAGLSGSIAAVSCVSSDACAAIAGGSRSAHWNGEEWSYKWMPRQATGEISCVSAIDCMAVGVNGPRPLAAHWDGSRWTRQVAAQPTPGPGIVATSSSLKAVSCHASSTGCIAVGQVVHFAATSNEAFALTERWRSTVKATTEAATSVKGTEATLNGTVNPEGSSTTYQFEYGTTTSYGTKVPLSAKGIGSGTEDVKVSDKVEGLQASTTYHFRVLATSAEGTSYGEDKTFTTLTPKWKLQSTPNPTSDASLADVSCASASECIAVGSPGAQRWSANKWSTMTNPSGGLTDVSCGSTSSCLAINGGLSAQRWNGTEWTTTTALTPKEATSSTLYGVSCTSSTFCIAVGSYALPGGGVFRTLAEKWDGSKWTILTTAFKEGGLNHLYAVSCTSSTSCTAIGTIGGAPAALRWNGTEWSTLAAPKESSSSSADLSCTAANACTAVPGNSAKVERWNGTEWSSATLPTPEGGSAVSLKGVSCATSTSCIAVGSYTKESKTVTLAEGWNGTSWSVHSTPNYPEGGGALGGVSCASSIKCTAAGNYVPAKGESKTLAARYDFAPAATTEAATSVKAAEATLNATVNPEGISTTYQFEYGKTTSYGSKIPVSAKEVGSGTSNVKVSQTPTGLQTGTTYHFRVLATNAEGTSYGEDKTFTTLTPKWTLQSTQNPSGSVSLADVSCAAASECIAVGSTGGSSHAQRWDGTKWSTMTSPSGANLTDVSCGSTTSCLALPYTVGLKVQRWNGTEWTVITAIIPAEATVYTFKSVSCTSSTFCMAVGGHGLLKGGSRMLAESWNGSKWTLLTTPFEEGGTNELNAVSCTSSTSCTAIGQKGGKPAALRWNGTEWTALAAPKEANNEAADISCTAASACTAVPGNSAKVERWNATEWISTTVPTPEGGSAVSLKGVSCASSSFCIAVGSYTKESKTVTLAEGWTGTTWSVQSTPNYPEGGGVLAGVSCSALFQCTAAGYYQLGKVESVTLAARYE